MWHRDPGDAAGDEGATGQGCRRPVAARQRRQGQGQGRRRRARWRARPFLFLLTAHAVRHTGLSSGARPDGLEEFMGAFARHVPSDQQYGAGGRGRALLRRQAARWREQRGGHTSSILHTPYLPTQHRTNLHSADSDALSPVQGLPGDTIYPQPSTHAWRAADAGRVPERGRNITARPISESWGWQPWDGAARENVVGVAGRLVRNQNVTCNLITVYGGR